MLNNQRVTYAMKKDCTVLSICGDSTAGNSFSHFGNGKYNNRSPQETSSVASGSNTHRHSRETFTNVLFNERPSAYKPLEKRKQSADFEDPDRHFSMDDSKLCKSKSLTDDIKQSKTGNKQSKTNMLRLNIQDTDTNSFGTVLDVFNDSTKNNNSNNSSTQHLKKQSFNITPLSEEPQNKSKFSNPMLLNRKMHDLTIEIPKNENVNIENTIQSHHHNQSLSRQNNKQHQGLGSTEGEFGVTRQTGSIVLETKDKDPQQLAKETVGNIGNLVNSYQNSNIHNSNPHNNNFTQSRMLFNSSAAQSDPDNDSNNTNATTTKAISQMMKYSFFACVISAGTGLSCYSYSNVYLFSLLNSGVFGESYCLLLLALVMNHPFFKITTESAKDSFTIPKYAFIGFSFCLSSLYGYIYRFKGDNDSIHLNGFNSLPLVIVISFLLFALCVLKTQPILFKRLKLNYGLREERELTLSESKAFTRGKTMVRGITQINLPHNLNNFLPDEQGPKIKSIRFFSSMIIILLLMHGLVYYAFNQYHIWHNKISENEGYFHLMAASFLVLGEILAGIVYKVDSYFNLEFKYELEFVRGVFSSYLFRVIYLIQPSFHKTLILPLIKMAFKIIIFYLYPTHYESVKNCVRRILSRCFKDSKDAEFKEMQRRLFTKRLGIAQFTDSLSLFSSAAVVACLCLVAQPVNANAKFDADGNVADTKLYYNLNDFKRFTNNQLWSLVVAGLLDLVLEIITTIIITYQLSKNPRFSGLSLKKLIQEVHHFLSEGLGITFLSVITVTACFAVLLSNDMVSFVNG